MNKLKLTPDGLGVIFEPPSSEKVTKQEAEFLLSLEGLILRVSSSFEDPVQKSWLLDKIIEIANSRGALGSTSPNFNQLLQIVQFPIRDEVIRIRQEYLRAFKKYVRRVLAISAILILAWLSLSYELTRLYDYAGPLGRPFVGTLVSIVGSAGFTGIGLVLGFSLNFYLISHEDVNIDNFDQVKRYNWAVSGDFFNLYVISAIILILLYFQILTIGILSLNLNQIQGQPWLGLLVGILCGVSEPLIAERIKQVFRTSTSKASAHGH